MRDEGREVRRDNPRSGRACPPCVVLLTPPGRGAVATLVVEGPGAVEAVEAVFQAAGGQPLGSLRPDRLVFGHIGGPSGEEVVLCRRSPQSVELHCHGGLAAAAMVRRILSERGCRPVAWQDWAAGAIEDPIQSAALVALAEARTARTAGILLDQYHGALRRAIQGIRHLLETGDVQGARQEADRLLRRASLGQHLTRPWQVVLTGPPNVGKSSLVNALLGYPRAIVDPVAGTTRDVVTATTALDGWPVEFSDTAGVRASDIPLEQAGILLAEEQAAKADLVVVVLDASLGPCAEQDGLMRKRRDALVVYNKKDLVAEGDRWDYPGLLTSAQSGEGILELAAAVSRRLVPDPPNPGDAVPCTVPQVEWIERVSATLSGNDAAGGLAIFTR